MRLAPARYNKDKAMPINREFLINWEMEPVVQRYTDKDTMLFALSLGLGMDPEDPRQLQYVYEEGLQAFPTMPLVLCSPQGWAVHPEAGINYRMMVHSEQRLKIHKPLPPAGTLRAVTRVDDVIDKGEGRGAILYLSRDIHDDESGELLATVSGTAFARADGGFGGPSGPMIEPHRLPEGEAEYRLEATTSPQMALLYRLNGDRNPIHASPEIARSARFPRPILHGLATYGVAANLLINEFAGGDPTRLQEYNARFSAPFFPGETLTVEAWKKGNEISFRAFVAERDAVVLNNGYAVLTS